MVHLALMKINVTKMLMAFVLSVFLNATLNAQSVGYVYEPRQKAFYEVVNTQIGAVAKPLGLRMNLSVNAFAGVGYRNRPIGGLTLTYKAKIADNVGLEIGPAVFADSGRPTGWGVFAGLSWRF